jgi:hypothetical protein
MQPLCGFTQNRPIGKSYYSVAHGTTSKNSLNDRMQPTTIQKDSIRWAGIGRINAVTPSDSSHPMDIEGE